MTVSEVAETVGEAVACLLLLAGVLGSMLLPLTGYEPESFGSLERH